MLLAVAGDALKKRKKTEKQPSPPEGFSKEWTSF